MVRKMITGTVILAVAMAFFVAVQPVDARPGRGSGPACSPELTRNCCNLTDEQLELRNEFREKKLELRNEIRKDTLDFNRITELKKEIDELKTSMGPSAPPERQLGKRGNRPYFKRR